MTLTLSLFSLKMEVRMILYEYKKRSQLFLVILYILYTSLIHVFTCIHLRFRVCGWWRKGHDLAFCLQMILLSL